MGRDSIGLYSPDDVRGFSAVVAGNLRIGGLYFDQQTAPTAHLISGAAVHVGLGAQGYAFPAPTGVVDYDLRTPTGSRSLSAIASGTSWGAYSLEVDGEAPISPTLSLGFGGGVYRDVFSDRTDARYEQAALIARWRPSPGVEITPFAEITPLEDNPATAIYVTVDGAAPKHLPRDYRGPQWDTYRGLNVNAGTLATAALGPDTSVRFGVFHSQQTTRSTYASLFLGLTPDGQADHVIVADPPLAYVSDSGELRVAHGLAEGPRKHLFLATLRARSVEVRYGGSDAYDFGQVSIDAAGPANRPAYRFGARTQDSVSQWSAGLSYSLSWQGLGEASVGVLKTDYRKRVLVPGFAPVASRDAPLLWNASAALHLTPWLSIFASHTLGLEQSGQAPDVAVNRFALTPAIRTRQSDAGLRWRPTSTLSLVAGAFVLDKPYDAVDPAGVFRRLGAVLNQGLEASLTGQITPSLTLVAGAVLLDAAVSGDAVRSGGVGRRPVNSTPAKGQVNLEYAPAKAPQWSFDAALGARGRLVATTEDRQHLPARATLDLGVRYRFKLNGTAAVLRAQVTNVGNEGGYVLLGPGAYKLADDRRAFLSLAADF